MKEPTIEITYNGMKYYSEVALAENQLKWYNLGKAVGIEEGKKSNGYSSDDIKKLHTDMNQIHHLWYDKGYNAGKDEGYKEGYTTGFDNGLDAATIANTTAVKPSPCNHGECIAGKEEEYDKGYYAGWEDGKNHIMQYI